MNIANKHSEKITILSFFMALGIVWTHSRMPSWDSVPAYFTTTLMPLNVVGETVVPAFFFITGFLFYKSFEMKDYKRKLTSRLKSLMVPYLLWNTLSAIGWFLAVNTCDGRFVSDGFSFDSIVEVLGNIVACKYSVLWYVGVIFVYCIASPLFFYLARKRNIGIAAIILFCIIGVSFHHPFCSPLVWMSVYMAGAWTGTHHKDFFFKPQPMWLTLGALVLFPIFFWMDYQDETMLNVNLRQWVAPFFFFGLYDIADRLLHFKSHSIYKYSFFLYASHYIPVHVLQRVVITEWQTTTGCWVAYLCVPVVVATACVALAWLLDKKLHPVYAVLSGDR